MYTVITIECACEGDTINLGDKEIIINRLVKNKRVIVVYSGSNRKCYQCNKLVKRFN